MKDVKWASFLFWNVLNPVFYTHHRFYRKKVAVDRFLEKQGFAITSSIGILFGGAFYLSIVSFLPGNGAPSGVSLEQNANAILRDLGMESTKEFPIFTLLRAKADIMTKLHAAMDRVDVRKQKEEVERLKREIASLKAPAAASSASPPPVSA